jgi:hypothetical protein
MIFISRNEVEYSLWVGLAWMELRASHPAEPNHPITEIKNVKNKKFKRKIKICNGTRLKK